MISKTNLKKPDHKQWKQIADIALYSLPLLTGVVASMPVSDQVQKWVLVAINIAVVGFKAVSKFTSNENTEVS